MRDYPQILNKIRSTPWLITEDGLQVILSIVDRRVSGEHLTDEQIQQMLQTSDRNRSGQPNAMGGVGLLPIHGPIFGKANMMTQLSGATSIEMMQQQFRSFMQNDQVGSVLLDVDSPGGVSDLVLEMGEEIREAREVKPIYAIANTQAGSAAYWLASQATKLYVTPSGHVGSIGVYAVHDDDSRLRENIGIDRTIVKAGRFKAELAEPMTENTEKWIQEQVNQTYAQFIENVALGRGVSQKSVKENYGEGRMLSAKDALKVGMVDGVENFDSVLSGLLAGNALIETPRLSAAHNGNSLRASYDKELEHSEPGSGLGGEPVMLPKENEDEDEWKNGERLHRPPNIPELEDSLMDREQLLQYAGRLGITGADALSDEELTAKVSAGLDDVLETSLELNQATTLASQQVAFAEQYPEQAERLRKLEEGAQLHEAASFANQLADFKVTEGEGDDRIETAFRLSVQAQETVRETHLKLSQGNLVHDDLKSLIQSVATGGVQQGEIGSSREEIVDETVIPTDRQAVRKMFNDRVTELMTNDKLDRKAATAEAARQYPQLALAYRQS